MKRNVIALLTATVMALTVPAFAADPIPPPPADSAALAPPANLPVPVVAASIPAATGTPLHLRSSSGASSSDGSHGSSGSLWKLGAIAAIIAGAAWYMRKKRGALGQGAAPTRAIQVISRASVGVRTELVVVDVDGMTLLLGVTPASVSRLAILSAGEIATAKDETEAEGEASEPAPRSAIPERFGALLEGLKRTPSVPRLVVDDVPMPVEPQARGLLALRKR